IGFLYGLFHLEKKILLYSFINWLYLAAIIQFSVYLIVAIYMMTKHNASREERQSRKVFFNYLFLFSGLTILSFIINFIEKEQTGRGPDSPQSPAFFTYFLMLSISLFLHWSIVRQLEIRWKLKKSKADIWPS